MSNTGLHIKAGFAIPHSTLEVVIEALDDKDNLLWNSICPEYTPSTFSVDAIKSLLEIHIVDIQLPLSFSALLDDVAQSEDLVYTFSPLSKTCLFLSKLLVHCFRDPLDDELS